FVDEVYRELACVTGCDVTAGTRVSAPLNAILGGVDFTLSPLATIAGTGTNPAGGPMPDVPISAFTTGASLVRSAADDVNGLYAVPGLASGDYYARATNPTGFSDVLFDGIACALGCDVTSGTKISALVGLVTTADFRLPDRSQPRVVPSIKWVTPAPI